MKSAHVLPLLEGGDPTSQAYFQLTNLVEGPLGIGQLSTVFRKPHSTITAFLKVVNDIIESLDPKENCAAPFIDLSKALIQLTTSS